MRLKKKPINLTINDLFTFKNIGPIAIPRTPYDIKYFKKEIHDITTCKGCQERRQFAIKKLSEIREKFPNCCDNHRILLTQTKFNYLDYTSTVDSVADKVLFTINHIKASIDLDNWKDEIINYLEYANESFGSYPIICGGTFGYSFYVEEVNEAMRSLRKYIDPIRYTERLDYVEQCVLSFTDKGGNSYSDSIENLASIYQKWLKSFPFDLPFFQNQRLNYYSRLGFLTGKRRYNPYTNKTVFYYFTSSELLDFLTKTTTKILDSIKTETLLNQKYITSEDQYKLDLISHKHRLDQKINLNKYSKEELTYADYLNKWFNTEIEFTQSIIPIFQKKHKNSNSQIKKYHYEIINCSTTDEPAVDLADSLILNGYISKADKTKFIHLFTKKPISSKITWLKEIGDLYTLVYTMNSLKKLKSNTSYWKVCACNFKHYEIGEFTNSEISKQKDTVNKEKIIRFINNL